MSLYTKVREQREEDAKLVHVIEKLSDIDLAKRLLEIYEYRGTQDLDELRRESECIKLEMYRRASPQTKGAGYYYGVQAYHLRAFVRGDGPCPF